MVSANVNDAVVYKATDIDAAAAMVQEDKFHILLFSWEGVDQKTSDLLTKIQKDPQHGVPIVALVDGDQENNLDAVKAAGINEYVQAPCSAASLAEAIMLASNPVNMRRAKRFSIPGTNAIISTKINGASFAAVVVNISNGGMLCELECPDNFLFKEVYSVDINFNLAERQLEASGLLASSSGMKVIDRLDDFSPKKIRLAFLFIDIPADSAQVLGQAFVFAEQQDGM